MAFRMRFALSIGVMFFAGWGSSATCCAQSPYWGRLRAGPRSGGFPHAVHDAARDRTLLIAAPEGSGSFLKQYEWDGTDWTEFSQWPVAARRHHATVYDALNQRIVLFGGDSGSQNGYQGGTWQWDGNNWSPVSASGPQARSHTSLVYRSSTDRVILFGGEVTNGERGDLWQLNFGTWVQIDANGPYRKQHAMAYDAQRDRIVLFGGRNNTGLLSDTWEWDGSNWYPMLFASGPGATIGHRMEYDTSRGVVVLTGGYRSSGASTETWEWNGASWSLRSSTVPWGNPPSSSIQPINFDTFVDSSSGRVRAIGTELFGHFPSSSRSVWEWDGTSWLLVTPAKPRPRSHHGMVYDSARQRTVMFGGRLSWQSGAAYGDTWEWDGVRWQLVATGGPSARYGCAMAYDPINSRVLLFGGIDNTGRRNDLWAWDGTNWSQLSTTGPVPTPRRHHAAAYDIARQTLIVFGGDDSQSLQDTWEWDGTSWSLASTTGPSARNYHTMAYDAHRGVTVLYGGRTNPSRGTGLRDTWEWDGSSWAMVSPYVHNNTPAASERHAMVYDSTRQAVLVIGGRSVFDGRTWAWDGNAWMALNPFDTFRHGYGAAYDSTRRRTVQFGGDFDFTHEFVWEHATVARIFGSGCGTPALAMVPDPAAPPKIGGVAGTSIANVPTPLSFVSLGLSNSTFGSFQLPVSLISFGMPGCDLLQSNDAGAAATSTGTGTAVFALPIPNNYGLLGRSLYLQAWAPAPGANPASIIVSNGVEFRIGSL